MYVQITSCFPGNVKEPQNLGIEQILRNKNMSKSTTTRYNTILQDLKSVQV